MVAPKYQNGQMVSYKPIGGPDSNTPETVGLITSIRTEPGVQADHNVNASMSEPRYEIQNANTGNLTSVYEKNIIGGA